MRAALLALLAALALPVPASAEWSCADATYASEVCPWFGEAADGYAVPSVAMRWSSDGYPPGSAAMNWNDGIYVIVTLPAAGPRDAAALLVDIAYEPHWQRGEPKECRNAMVTANFHRSNGPRICLRPAAPGRRDGAEERLRDYRAAADRPPLKCRRIA